MRALEYNETGPAVRDGFAGFATAHHDLRRLRLIHSGDMAYDPALWTRMAAEGWLSAAIREEDGGSGLLAEALGAIPELVGERLLPEPFIALGLLPSLLLAEAPAGSTRGACLAGVLDGSRRIAVAWQEVSDQSIERVPDCRLGPSPNGLFLSGTKAFIAAGAGVDAYLVTACIGDQPAIVMVPSDARGVVTRALRQVDNSVAAEVTFTEVQIQDSQVISRSLAPLVRAADLCRLAVASQLLGIARQALELTRTYSTTRHQFGQPIGSFQALQHRMVDFGVRIRLAEAVCDDAVRKCQSADHVGFAAAAAAAKATATEAALIVTRGAIQIHGAIGYTDEADIGLYLAAALRLAPWLGGTAAMGRRFSDLNGAKADD